MSHDEVAPADARAPNEAPAEARYQLVSSVTCFSRSGRIAVSDREMVREIDADADGPVGAVLRGLEQPKTLRELAEASGLGEDDVGEVLDLLLAEGAVERASAVSLDFASTRVAAALAKGALLLGDDATTPSVAEALRAAGIDVTVLASAHPSDLARARGCLVVACFQTVHDRRRDQLEAAALELGLSFVPVVLMADETFIGPLRPSATPCSTCLALRVMARVHWHQVELWDAAEREPVVRFAARTVDGRAQRVAAALLGFLSAVDDDGAFAGRRDAAVRVCHRTGLVTAHRVIRHAHCPACGPSVKAFTGASAAPLDDAARAYAERWRAILRDDVDVDVPDDRLMLDYNDPATGIFKYAEEWSERAHYFRRFPLCWGGVALARGREHISTGFQGINGTGPTLQHRRLVSMSEGIERYAQYTHRPYLVGVPYRDVAGHAFDPRGLILYEEEQYRTPGFPRPRFSDDHPLNWTWGCSLKTGEAKLFPQELVTPCLTDDTYPNRVVDQNLTTGGASHVSYRRALLNGLREVIERDQYVIAWYKRMALRRVRLPPTLPDAYADELLRFVDAAGMDVVVLDLRIDFDLPAFLTLGRMRERRGNFDAGGMVVVATADLDPRAALSRGLCELALHYETLGMTPDPAKDWRNTPYDPEDVEQGWRTWFPTYLYYLNPANAAKLSFLVADDTVALDDIAPVGGVDPRTDVEHILAALEERDLEAFAFDLVSDEIAEIGFRVCKVLVPGLVELTPGRQSRRLATSRLDEVAARAGRPCLPPGERNRDPHANA